MRTDDPRESRQSEGPDVQWTLTGENRGDHLLFQLDLETLAPLLVETYDAFSGTSTRFDFGPSEMRMRCAADCCPPAGRNAAGEAIDETIPLEAPVFEFFQASWGTHLAILPLRSGYRATLPVLKPGAGCHAVRLAAPGARWMTFEVGEPEHVAFEGRAVKAWRNFTASQVRDSREAGASLLDPLRGARSRRNGADLRTSSRRARFVFVIQRVRTGKATLGFPDQLMNTFTWLGS